MKEVNGYNPSKDPRLIDCKTECGNDKCYARRYGLFAEKTCPNFVEPKPITNADRIRSMTDEELADWLGVYCNGQTAQEVGKPCVSDMGSCEECWLDWLKEECE